MRRQIEHQLLEWKNHKDRKPLILLGVRQSGKSYCVEHFGRTHFAKSHRIDFFTQKNFVRLFEALESFEPTKIIADLEFALETSIDPQHDFLFFDEIQDCPQALASLKAFQEKMPQMAIIAAGSFLGLMSKESFFPVGKVDILSLNPLSFEEFLMNYQTKLFGYYQNIKIEDMQPIDSFYHQELSSAWRLYSILGGLPEVLASYLNNSHKSQQQALLEARRLQKTLLSGYQSDFSKHAGTINANHILHVFESVPMQLAKTQDESTKRFYFNGVIPRQKGFESVRGPLTWLSKSRLLIKTLIANHSGHPLKGFCEENRFKLYFLDSGLLQASLDLPIEALMLQKLDMYKGYILENLIAQEIFFRCDQDLISWVEGTSEIEFLITLQGHIVPVEVKSSLKSVRSKSLDAYIDRYHPSLALKLSGQNVKINSQKKTVSLPHYLIGKIFDMDMEVLIKRFEEDSH